MSGRHQFKDLIDQLPPERRTAIAERTADLLAAMPAPQTEGAGNPAQATGRSSQPRDTYRYYYKVGNKIVFTGITNNPARREAEHRQAHPGGHINKQGPKVTRASAERWERQQKTRQFKVTRTSTARWERQRKVISRTRTAGYRHRGRPTEGYR